jgi:prevent-host-death family protein
MARPHHDRPEVVSKAQFKPKALEYFRKVQETGKPIIITDNGVPVLQIVAYHPDPAELLEELRGSVLAYEQPLEPVGMDDWEAAR